MWLDCLVMGMLVSVVLVTGWEERVLQQHNDVRRRTAKGEMKDSHNVIQPPASNMKQMKWNSTLEREAQRYANSCPVGHPPNPGNFGENLAWGKDNTGDPTILVDNWVAELTSGEKIGELPCPVSNSTSCLSPQNAKRIGHYVQMIWADSHQLGCAFKEDCNRGGTLVCRYYPAGNWEGEAIYVEGEACATCPKGYECRDSMCSK